MGEKSHEEQLCAVYPTLTPGGAEKDRVYSDIALTGLFNAHIVLFTQEVQWFWRHYQIMLLANSFIFGFFLNLKNPTLFQAFFGLVFGLVFCWLWWKMTYTASVYQDIWQEAAQRFNWPEFKTGGRPSNPISYAMERRKEVVKEKRWCIKDHRIRTMSRSVILMFAVSYVCLFISHIMPSKS